MFLATASPKPLAYANPSLAAQTPDWFERVTLGKLIHTQVRNTLKGSPRRVISPSVTCQGAKNSQVFR